MEPDEVETLLARVRAQRPTIDEMDLARKAAGRSEPLLVICSDDDEMTPIDGARELAAAWPGATLLEAQGLGHNLAMRDPAYVGAALRFALG